MAKQDKIDVTDEMVERAINSCADILDPSHGRRHFFAHDRRAMRSALEAALNPPTQQRTDVSPAQLEAGVQALREAMKKAADDPQEYEQIALAVHRAMRALEHVPMLFCMKCGSTHVEGDCRGDWRHRLYPVNWTGAPPQPIVTPARVSSPLPSGTGYLHERRGDQQPECFTHRRKGDRR